MGKYTRPTDESIRRLLRFDSKTGKLFWTERVNRRVKAGGEAGTLTRYGYKQVCISKYRYMAHRLVFFLATGAWPLGSIDHLNGIKTDNRLANLRVTDASGNAQNQRRAHRNSATGLLGVSPPPKGRTRFRATIHHRGKTTYIGSFATPEEAHKAYLAAKSRIHLERGV